MKNFILNTLLISLLVGLIGLFSCGDDDPPPEEPTASFTAQVDATDPFTFVFTNASLNATSYSWAFGDTNTSTEENPTHTYSTDGTFTVSLTATGPGGSNTTTQNVTVIDPDQVAYDAATAENGGRLYDKFWADETDFVSPSDPTVDLANITDFGDFYRCKGCHAWDQKGTIASYIDRGPKTTRMNVSSVNLSISVPGMTIRELFDEIEHDGGAAVDPARTADGTDTSLGGDQMADYGKILSESQIWDLVKFLKEGTLDTELLYDIQTTGTYPDGSREFLDVGKDGDAVAGNTFYQANCASCHGANGRDDDMGVIIPRNEDIGRSMGQFAREKPYEMQHKTRYGNLGSSPPMLGEPDATADDIKNMFKALADTTNFPDL